MDGISDEQLWSWVDRQAPELEEHLRLHPEDRARVEDLRTRLGLFFPPEEPLPHPARIGPYKILRVVGEGGMGLVYEARQPNPVRSVALKVIRGDLASKRAVHLFRREAEALARLAHPGIATIFEAGETTDGRPYLAMELVRGRPLDAYAQERKLDSRATVALFLQVCDAVEHAHRHGVIHRDLKPPNILVDADGRARVLDFGLARFRDRSPGTGEARTMAGDLLGTLPYMSPEQARGLIDQVDERSDVYSLGVVLYRVLSGEAPYPTDPQNLPASLQSICQAQPRRLRAKGRRIDKDLETIVFKTLEKEPDHRYGGPGELASDLRRFLASEPVVARRANPARRILLAARRHPAAAATFLLLSVLAVVAPILLTSLSSPKAGFLDPTSGDGYPELSPFEKVRWRGQTPLVTIDGREWILLEVNGLEAGFLVAYTQQIKGPQFWTKRFEEDFVQILTRAREGRGPGTRVDLKLRDPSTGEAVERQAWPMTPENRQALWEAGGRAPWSGVRWDRDRVVVEIDGQWWHPLSVDGIVIDEILDYCRKVWGGSGRSAFRCLILRALQDLGGGGGDTVAIEVKDPATGARQTLPKVSLSRENQEAIDRNLREGRP